MSFNPLPYNTACAFCISPVRSVHRRLLLMHLLAMLAQLAGIWQYVVSVTDAGCVAAHRVMMASLVLFDVRAVRVVCLSDSTASIILSPTSPPPHRAVSQHETRSLEREFDLVRTVHRKQDRSHVYVRQMAHQRSASIIMMHVLYKSRALSRTETRNIRP